MKIKGKQLVDNALNQQQMNISTDSIIEPKNITNKEYVDGKVIQKLNEIKHSSLNLDMSANNATVGELACDTAVIEFPLSNILVKVNGVDVNVGENEDCYFSPDGGATIRENGEEQKGDYLYWNSSSFDLEDDDEIDFRYLTGYEYETLEENTTVELHPTYESTVVRYTGGDGTTMNVIIEDTTFVVGNVGGQFVWDIGGVDEHTFTSVGESIIQLVNGNDYTIWYDGVGSLIFSVQSGDYVTPPPILINTINSFGANYYGGLGMGDTTDYQGAIQTPSFTNVVKFIDSAQHMFILKSDGTVQSFGRNNYGQLGMGNTTDYGGAIQTPSFTNVKDIVCGYWHTIILFNDGTIKSFGDNSNGELGMGNTTNYNGAIVTPSFTNVKEVICDKGKHTFIILEDGTVQSFGSNTLGQLGMGNRTNYNGAIQTPSNIIFDDFKFIKCGYEISVVCLNDDTIRVFGSNVYGQLGMGNQNVYNGEILNPQITNVKDVSVYNGVTFYIFNDDTVKCVGNNRDGELGMGDTNSYYPTIQTPVSLTNVNKIRTSDGYTIVLLNDGTVRTFGDNSSGQIGMGTTTDYAGAIQIPNFTNVADIAGSRYEGYFLI